MARWQTRVALVALLMGCSSEEGTSPPAETCPPAECSKISPQPSPEQTQQETALRQKLEATSGLTAETLVAAHAVPFEAPVARDLKGVLGYDKIASSSLAPGADEASLLASQGFSVSTSKHFPSFTYGYSTIYMEDLPVYISADSILHAAHKSYDKALEFIEVSELNPSVRGLLESMRGQLAQGGAGWMNEEGRADLDLFLAVGLSLLDGQVSAPVAGADKAQLSEILDKAVKAQGTASVRLFGVPRDVDFSQFKPRGHYEGNPILERYFRAMMWFGRTEFRLIETVEGGTQVFRRRQFEASVALTSLMDEASKARFAQIDETIGAFVGEHDSMTVAQVGSLLADLGVSDPAGLGAIKDEALAQAILTGGYGAQRIASQLMVNGTHKTFPLHRAFQLFGQRYTLDSHVFSNVVYDRVQGGAVLRMMPSPLDAAYAALGNDQAASLLGDELKKFSYAPDLESMRILTDEHGQNYWGGSLYTLWLSAIRGLSPSEGLSKGANLPAVAKSEAWGRRVLNTQLASWAELRHDTLLYAKQSYTGGASCEFPDAYVDPYPEFYARMARYAERGSSLVDALSFSQQPSLKSKIKAHFESLRGVSEHLRGMAEAEGSGNAFSAEQMAFINDAVVIKTNHEGCVEVETASGWYPSLFLGGSDDALLYDPTIADVHTQPTDENGAPVGKVLHVGTDRPRRMIVVADTCSGPRAYVGLVSAYHELITEQFQRVSDSEWATMSKPPSPSWLNGVLSP